METQELIGVAFTAVGILAVFDLCSKGREVVSEFAKSELARDPWTAAGIRPILPDLDKDTVILIERLSFHQHSREWPDFLEELQIGCRIIVYETSNLGVIGYLSYFITPGVRVEILRFAVMPAARKLRIAHEMLSSVIHSAMNTKTDLIICDVPEDRLPAQQLLKSMGFLYMRTLPDEFKDSEETDMYRFEMSVEALCERER